jgi:hypothetical protein
VGKLLSTNDAFLGLQSVYLNNKPTVHGDHFHSEDAYTLYPLAFDAGSEANTGVLCEYNMYSYRYCCNHLTVLFTATSAAVVTATVRLHSHLCTYLLASIAR